MQGPLESQTDAGLITALRLMEEAFEENPTEFGGLAGSMSQICEHAQRRIRELLGVPAPGILH